MAGRAGRRGAQDRRTEGVPHPREATESPASASQRKRRRAERFDAIVVGAGAAGLMAAATAARRGRKVLVLDRSRWAGAKIRASGGGHCNFTNLSVSPEDYLSENPHFPKSALARFRPEDFLAFLKRHRIAWIEKEEGRLFCRGPASRIADMLAAECRAAGAAIRLGKEIVSLKSGRIFEITVREAPEPKPPPRGAGSVRHGEKGRGGRRDARGGKAAAFEAPSIVVATGGLARPDLGATGLGLRLAKRFGLAVVPPLPALAPLLFRPGERKRFGGLAGVSLPGRVACGKRIFEGDILFTHDGLSGPAILDASLAWREGEEIAIDFLPRENLLEIAARARQSKDGRRLKTILAERLPRRLADALLGPALDTRPAGRYTLPELESLARAVHGLRIVPAGTGGFSRAEVTAGGVDTREISSKTMESRSVRGLFFIGELLDVTGRLGGFNLHWAWASGFAAGEAL